MTEEDRNLVPIVRIIIVFSALSTAFTYLSLPLAVERVGLFGPGWLFLVMAAWSGTKR